MPNGLTNKQLLTCSHALYSRAGIPHEKSSALRDELAERSVSDDAVDLSVMESAAALSAAQINRQRAVGDRIRNAIEKLRSGVYGLCERCEEPVGYDRLSRVPEAEHCFECQTRLDKEAGF